MRSFFFLLLSSFLPLSDINFSKLNASFVIPIPTIPNVIVELNTLLLI